MTEQSTIPGIVTTQQAAAILGVHRNHAASILAQAGIKYQVVGTAYAWPENEVKRLAIKRTIRAMQRKFGGRV